MERLAETYDDLDLYIQYDEELNSKKKKPVKKISEKKTNSNSNRTNKSNYNKGKINTLWKDWLKHMMI